ncbi:hypothetical protein [Cycloclasticus pugetii]|jgi:hypothetical protein|uniref:hypothetical protein n=1 Tax=Cycloclasticus pugetii TaxID=34068 RepID=UPI000919765A|nr:hypothetical protein [Cycloclasticus pugetii]SHJ72518.1 hypothetical protein SAMN05519226_0103 [Cycloclasticus pugetii]|tara:strand:+ start:109 stop:267 length:159 start_codon:yes stop_codon:yes gene_type:complete
MTEKKDNKSIEQPVSHGCCGDSEKQEKVEVKKESKPCCCTEKNEEDHLKDAT